MADFIMEARHVQGSEMPAPADLDIAHTLFHQGDFIDAATLAVRIMELHPANEGEAAALAARAYLEAGRYDHAAQVIAASKMMDGLVSACIAARIVFASGDRDLAIRDLQIAVDTSSSKDSDQLNEAKLDLSAMLIEVGDPRRAIRTIGGLALSGAYAVRQHRLLAVAGVRLGDLAIVGNSIAALAADETASAEDCAAVASACSAAGLHSLVLDISASALSRRLHSSALAGYEIAARAAAALDRHADPISREQIIKLEAGGRVHIADRALLGVTLLRLALLGETVLPADEVLRIFADGLRLSEPSAHVLGALLPILQDRITGSAGVAIGIAQHADHREIARLLNSWGNTAVSQSLARAGICFGTAAFIAPNNQVGAFSFAHVLALVGAIEEARRWYARIGCIGPDDGGLLFWPPNWPARPLPTEHYESLKPADSDWPKISIVVPTYNQGGFIEDALLSLLNQDYPHIEIIVIDGSSDDDTMSIVRRYKDRLAHVVSEPDRGQSDAINKGMALATGDLVTWLNSDDMLAPGALHIWALEWLRTKADLLFGICVTHRNQRIDIVNQPRAKQSDFTPRTLADIGDYWLRGHFFYQPEVVFTREIWLRAGGKVDTHNNYCMDYDLWMRFAELGARIAKVRWPTALFRRHDAQKTAQLDRCVQEQGKVRDTYVAELMSPERRRDILDRIKTVMRMAPLSVQVVTSQISRIFSPRMAREVEDWFRARGIRANLSGLKPASQLMKHDVVIILVHLEHEERAILAELRRLGFKGLVVGWFWDNHRKWRENLDTSALIDVAVPGHEFCKEYLRTTNSLSAPSVPLSVTRWSRGEVEEHWNLLRPRFERKRELSGRFVRYKDAPERNRRLTRLITSGIFPELVFIEPEQLGDYFNKPRSERFVQSCGYATSLSIPFDRDLSQRFFDALITGQVPVCAHDIIDLSMWDRVRREFIGHFVLAKGDEVSEIEEAHRQALELYEAGGIAGMEKRHELVLDRHMFVHRLVEIIDILGTYATDAITA
jgi:tetratricopeptide (TPR) repeat protein